MEESFISKNLTMLAVMITDHKPDGYILYICADYKETFF